MTAISYNEALYTDINPTTVKISKSMFAVHCAGTLIGYVARGSLDISPTGLIKIKGREWYVLGFEYCPYPSARMAAEALCDSVRMRAKYSEAMGDISRFDPMVTLVLSKNRRKSMRSIRRDVLKKYAKLRKNLVKKGNNTILSSLIRSTKV